MQACERRGAYEAIVPPRETASAATLPFVSELSMKSAVLLQTPLIASIGGFLTPEECMAWIDYGEKRGFSELDAARTAGYALRRNGRIALDDADVAAAIFARVKAFVPREILIRTSSDGPLRVRQSVRPVGCAPNLRLYRYTVGQAFGKHVDDSVVREEFDEPGAATRFTLLVYLNDGIDGGATVFYPDEDEVDRNSGGGGKTLGKRARGRGKRAKRTRRGGGDPHRPREVRFDPQRGACIVHRHGNECLEHEGEQVRRGVKYLLRTDVVYA